jgi:hypothetical protein
MPTPVAAHANYMAAKGVEWRARGKAMMEAAAIDEVVFKVFYLTRVQLWMRDVRARQSSAAHLDSKFSCLGLICPSKTLARSDEYHRMKSSNRAKAAHLGRL